MQEKPTCSSCRHFVQCERGLWLHTKYSLPTIKVENSERGVGEIIVYLFLFNRGLEDKSSSRSLCSY